MTTRIGSTRGLLAEILAAAKEQGWEVGMTRRNHIRLVPRDKSQPAVVTSGTPSDQRALRNTLSQCKRSGLIWPWPPEKGEK